MVYFFYFYEMCAEKLQWCRCRSGSPAGEARESARRPNSYHPHQRKALEKLWTSTKVAMAYQMQASELCRLRRAEREREPRLCKVIDHRDDQQTLGDIHHQEATIRDTPLDLKEQKDFRREMRFK